MSDDTQTPAPTAEPKKTRQMSFTVLETGEIRADFGPGLDPIAFNPAELPEGIFPQAVAEGVISRLRGYTSKLSDSDRTPANLRTAIAKGLENLQAGIWAVQRAPGAGGEYSIEAEAAYLYRKGKFEAENPGQVYTNTLAQDAEAYAALSEDTKNPDGTVTQGQKSKLKKVARYAAAYAQVKADRAAKKAAKLASKAEESEEESDF